MVIKSPSNSIVVTTFLLFLILFSRSSFAQVISGRIVNEEKEPIPYATIFSPELREGTISNSEGYFKINALTGINRLQVRSMGYKQKEMNVKVDSDSIFISFIMQRQEFEIKEVKVFPGKEDPAMLIMRKAIAKAPYYREKIKHYEADLYIKSNFSFSNIPRLFLKKAKVNGMDLKEVLKENITYVIESQNQIIFDYPNKYDQKIISKKTSFVGFEEPPVMELMTINFYEERPNDIVSPLSPLALKNYKFKFEGFITSGDYDIYKIKVTPKRKSNELIDGHIYIVDGLWCIYQLDFSCSFKFFNYKIKQQFENMGNDNWLPVSHNIDGDLSLLGIKGMFYYGASLKYQEIEDNSTKIPAENEEDQIYVRKNQPGEKELLLRQERELIISKETITNADVKKAARLNRKILKEQYKDSTLTYQPYNEYNIEELVDSLKTDDLFWDTIRSIPLSEAEIRGYQITDSLIRTGKVVTDSVTGENKIKEESIFSKILFGNNDLLKDSAIQLNYSGVISPDDFGYNAVDGYFYAQQMKLTTKFGSEKSIEFTPKLGYAFNRKVLLWNAGIRFRNILSKRNDFSFNVGKNSRDFKSAAIGINPTLNAVSSWFFAKNYMKLYETKFIGFELRQSFGKNIGLQLNTKFDHFYPLENNSSYLLSNKKEYSSNTPKGRTDDSSELAKQKSFTYSMKGIYYKRIRKPWLETSPFLFIDDYYRFEIQFTKGIPDVFSSVSDFSHLNLLFRQQANLTSTSGIDWQINSGYFFNNKKMHFSQYKHFSTAEIPVYFNDFSNTLQLINDYEASSNKSYLNISGEFRTEYFLLRYLSLINQQTWSESLHFNYLTTPDFKNYWEAGYSLNSIFFLGNIGVFAGFREKHFEQFKVKATISAFD